MNREKLTYFFSFRQIIWEFVRYFLYLQNRIRQTLGQITIIKPNVNNSRDLFFA